MASDINTLEPIQRLATQLSRLPGIGSKSALRLAYSIIEMDSQEVAAIANALVDAKEKVHYCSRCGNYTVDDLCRVCMDAKRNAALICVVSEPRDILALERTHDFSGTYHVLHGVISPMDGVGPDDINIPSLLERVKNERVKEVIVATNPDIEGEATASYLLHLLKPLGIRVTRIAHGVPIGGSLEYIDEMTLQKALEGRREM